MRTPQQEIGDRLEAAVLALVRQWFPDAQLSRGSGSVKGDGDVKNVPFLFIECKNTDEPGKGRSVSKKDWEKAKRQARRQAEPKIPAVVGFDDDKEILALIPLKDLIGLLYSTTSQT